MKLCCIMLFLLICTVPATLMSAAMLHGGPLKIVRSDNHGIVVELEVGDFTAETVEHDGQVYQRLVIPNMTQTAKPGEPQIPIYGAMVGISSPDKVSIEVLDADYETLNGYPICPAPGFEVRVQPPPLTPPTRGEEIATSKPGQTGNSNVKSPLPVLSDAEETGNEGGLLQQIFVLDKNIYSNNAFYPNKTAEIGSTGFMRDQAFATVQFYPVQCNPVTGELHLYRRIVARITWDDPLSKSASGVQTASAAYEDMLKRSILNYDTLARPPVMKKTPGIIKEAAQSSHSNDTAIKIGVTEDGLYKVTYSDLNDAGLNPSDIDPHKIVIKCQGTETPVYVAGEDDGAFDTDDYLLFYGTAITDIYTAKNMYWLTVEEDDGQRMNTVDGTLSGSVAVPAYFPATLHAEENTQYWQGIPDGKGEDHWFWGEKFSDAQSEDYSLTLNNISAITGTATVRVRLKGINNSSNTNPDHHTKIYLNEVEIDDQWWDGQSIFDHEVVVSHSSLNEGTNTVRVESVGDTGATVDQIFLNWIEIDYFDTYVAEDDRLLFVAPDSGTFQFEVTGFSSSNIEVFDVTEPDNVVRITNTTILKNGDTYTVKFEDTAASETQYLVQAYKQRKTPDSIEKDKPTSWKSAGNEADYIIITHEDFYSNSLKLANHRSDSGLRVVTAKVGDIYDEFNYGIFNPQAIKDFLEYAYNNWVAPAPTYVMLIGDACQDYKDYLNSGTINYVPSQIVETDILGETPSDNWFVCVSGDDILPDMFIGRLSAQEETQVDDIVDKVISYEQNPPDNTWNKKALLVADDGDSAFEDLSEELADILPENYRVNRVYIGDYSSSDDPTSDIKNYINAGSLLLNYTGHGAVEEWGTWNKGEYFFGNSDVTSLENTNKLTFVTIANCLSGFFTGRNIKVSTAEEFQRLKNKGAVAVWAPTALSYTAGHRLLMKALYETIFQDKQYGLGAATTAAKTATYSQNSYWSELVETFVLFGDPATQLAVSESTETELTLIAPDGGESIRSGASYIVQWSAPQDMEKFTLMYSLNNGRKWKKIAKNKVEGASYKWNVPSVKKTMKKCLVKVIGFDESGEEKGTDVSDAAFTIRK